MTGGSYDLSRRQVLRYLAYGSAGVVGASALASCTSDDAKASAPGSGADRSKASSTGPLLVVIELGGGNDGPSTIVPVGQGRYHQLRPTTALAESELIDLGDGFAMNRRLQKLAARKPAIVFGLGTDEPDLSHFEMLDRWWHGQPHGADPKAPAGSSTGFLGRLCDAIHGDERFTGVSLKFGNPPALRCEHAATTGLPPSIDAAELDQDPDIARALSKVLASYDVAGKGTALGEAAVGVERTRWIFDMLHDLPSPSEGYPDSDLGLQLAVASRLARSDHGIRVIHVPMAGSGFDTHAEHRAKHDPLMVELDAGLDRFLEDMADAGIAERMLVATTSEFGRRPEEHDGGLDHGTANDMLMWGPVHGGFHGDPVSWTKFDDKDNFIATTSFDRYLALMAEWMGVDPAEVLEGTGGKAPTALPGILRT